MLDQEIRQTILDEDHLKLLSICYYVSAGCMTLFSFFSLIYFVMGIFILIAGRSVPSAGRAGEPPPEFMGAVFIALGLTIFLLMILGAILKFIAGSRIRQRRSRIFCMIVAGIGCLEFPYGTLLGIFTFIVLARNSVRKLFEATPDIH